MSTPFQMINRTFIFSMNFPVNIFFFDLLMFVFIDPLWPYLHWSKLQGTIWQSFSAKATVHSTEACVINIMPCSLQHNEIKPPPSSSGASTNQPVLLFWPPSLCGESQTPSAGAWYVFLLTYTHTLTHPLLQRNVSYFWAPKVSQTSRLVLMRYSLDHCVFWLFSFGSTLCVLICGNSLIHLFAISSCSQQFLGQAHVVCSAKYSWTLNLWFFSQRCALLCLWLADLIFLP